MDVILYNKIAKIEGKAKNRENILDPSLLATGTIQTVVVSRSDDAFTFSGTASGTSSSESQVLPLIAGHTYTIKVYTASTKRMNLVVKYLDKSGSTISMDAWNAADDLNKPHKFTVPSNAVNVKISIGVVNGIVYSDEVYRFSVQEGESNDKYVKYGNVVSAIDVGARNAISDLAEKSRNILNPAWLGIGTIKNVTVSRVNDIIRFKGTANGTDALDGTKFDLTYGKNYTIIVYSESSKKFHTVVKYYNSSNTELGYQFIFNLSDHTQSINTPYKLEVPSGTVKAVVKVGVVSGQVYDYEQLRYEVVEGSQPSEYNKYDEIVSAVDRYARKELRNGLVCYVSPTGNNNNSGASADYPFATIQHAIDNGFKRIMLAPGSYKNQKVNISNKNGISIICNTSTTESNLFESHNRQARAKLDNSIDVSDFTAYNSIYRTALEVDENSSYYKVFVSKTVDPVYSGADYYGRVTTYNAILWEITDSILTCTRLVPKLTIADCEATAGTFHYDGTYLYVHPTNNSVTGKTYKRLSDDTFTSATQGFYINNSTDIYIEGLDIQFFPYNDFLANIVSGLEMRDCGFFFTCYGSASVFQNCNGDMKSCHAAQAGADGFGINSCGNASFYDCSAVNCYDDGISHHDGSTGVIDGGIYTYNYKGGVTPSFGSNVTVKNVVATYNVYGIFYTQGDNRTTDGKQVMQNCLSVDNTTKDIQITGYDVMGINCAYGTKQVETGATFTEYNSAVIS